MLEFPPTLILRHRKENLKKCSLRGLKEREGFHFYSYPLTESLPDLAHYVILSIEGPLLAETDAKYGLLLIDGTWRHAAKMQKILPSSLKRRSLPCHFRTAYPRRQEDCSDPIRGLASIEALYIAYQVLQRDTSELLDHYYWKEPFLRNAQGYFPVSNKL